MVIYHFIPIRINIIWVKKKQHKISINEDVEKIVPSHLASDDVNSFNHCCGKYFGSFT